MRACIERESRACTAGRRSERRKKKKKKDEEDVKVK